MSRFDTPPTLAEIDEIARTAMGQLPAAFQQHLTDLVVAVEEFPDADTMAALECDSPFDLLGLYRGVSLDRKSVLDSMAEPDMVFLYRSPILDYWISTGEDLTHLIRHVMIHEIGHHFGFSDSDMEELEAAAS
ncbi:MAG: metallopeptidase family protein [Rhodospirillaceae bacterium]